MKTGEREKENMKRSFKMYLTFFHKQVHLLGVGHQDHKVEKEEEVQPNMKALETRLFLLPNSSKLGLPPAFVSSHAHAIGYRPHADLLMRAVVSLQRMLWDRYSSPQHGNLFSMTQPMQPTSLCLRHLKWVGL